MAIAVDASSPAVASGTGTATLTSASFTPPAGALLVAISCGGWGGAVTTSTITDSLSGTWTSRVTANGTNNGANGIVQISTRVIGSSAAMTVTAAYTNNSGGRMLGVYVITGASTTTFGATGVLDVGISGGQTGMTTSLTTTMTGSLVLGGVDSSGTTGTTASLAANTAWASMSGTNPVSNSTDQVGYGIIKASALTGTPSAKTYGVTWNSATNGHLALLEVVPPTTSTVNGSDGTSSTIDTATVAANVPAVDTAGGVDVATVTAPVAAADAGGGTDAATVRLTGVADSGSADESNRVVSGGSTLVFASDAATSVDGTAPMAINGADTGTAADALQTATLGIQGPLPPGPRIVRIGQST